MAVKTPGRNRSNVLVGAPDVKAAGGFQLGPVATDSDKFPKNATDKLEDSLELKPGGYISKDGLTKTVGRDTEKIEDWNGDTVIILQTSHNVSLKFTVLEAANAHLLKHIFGEENVKVSNDGKNIVIVDNADELPHFAINFDIKGSATAKIRLFSGDAQVTNVGDVTFVRSDVIKYELEVECFDDIDTNKFYQFIDRTETGDDAGNAATPGGGNATPTPPAQPGTQPAQPPVATQPTTVEVKKRIDVPDDATGGTWTLTVGTETISDLAYNVSPTTLRSKLQAVSGIKDVIVRREGTRDFAIEFTAPQAVDVTADGSGLTGGASTDITVTDAA